MFILIPMAGEGKRFADAGYSLHKPIIPTIDYRSGNEIPMVVCATNDLYDAHNDANSLIYIDRDFHRIDGVETIIKQYYPYAEFINVNTLTEGQACTCLLAKDRINNGEPLLIASCDNGMIYSKDSYEAAKQSADILVFTFRNNDSVLKKPDAYGWMRIDNELNVTGVSIKKSISNNPLNDHAVTGTFWFRKGCSFVDAAERMIRANDRINNEFYVDQVIKYAIDMKLTVKVFEVDRYLCWGTPDDYENYNDTYKYWKKFRMSSFYMGN